MASPLARAFEEVRHRIAAACARSLRDPLSVELVAVSKNVPVERVRELVALGHGLFGENRVQEALGKIQQVGGGTRWHLVGHLQRNKVRHAVGTFDLIHTVDDLDLAREVGRRASARGITQKILVQVNLSREETKSGADEEGLIPLLAAIREIDHLDLRGLMTIPPPVASAPESRPWFARLRALRKEAEMRLDLRLPDLSMGMTDDFEVAVEEGATLVRVGRALFDFGDSDRNPTDWS